MHSLTEGLRAYVGMAPASRAAGTVEGSAIDTLGYEKALIVVNSGTNEATGTLDVTVEHCATSGGTYVAITGAAFTQITTANDNAIYVGEIGLGTQNSINRYIHVQFVTATAAGVAGAVVILARKNQLPVSQAATVAFNI